MPAIAQQEKDTLSVYFELDKSNLNTQSRKQLDSLYYTGTINHSATIDIIGYADFLAGDQYNLQLSKRRAQTVKDFLIDKGFSDQNIRLVTGKGEVKRKDTLHRHTGPNRGFAEDRRVDIIYYVAKPKSVRRNYDTVIQIRPSYKKPATVSTRDTSFNIDRLTEGQSFVLNNIYFPMGRHYPRKESFPELNKLVEIMLDNEQLAIQIEGHVCCVVGVPDAYDLDSRQMDLSVNRARFIYEYIIARGVEPERVKYVGYGRSRPVIENEQTEDDANANRRVEIRILRK